MLASIADCVVRHVCGVRGATGRWVEVSTRCDAAVLLLGAPSIEHVTCVVPTEQHASQARHLLARHIASGRCDVMCGTAVSVVDRFGVASVDVVYVDDAAAEELREALDAWLPRLNARGVICGHNLSPAWPRVVAEVQGVVIEQTNHDAPATPRSPTLPTIAVLTPCLGLGGAEMWIRSLVRGCRGYNWRVCSLTSDHSHPLIVDAVAASAELHTAGGYLHAAAIVHDDQQSAVDAAIRGADAVIAWGGGSYWPLDTDAPVVFVGHGSCQWTVRATLCAVEGGATHFVAVSPLAADAMRTVTEGRAVTTILNGVDTTRLVVPGDRRAIRTQWSPDAYDYTRFVGYCGRLSREKNVDSIIHAVASLPSHYLLVLIGCTGVQRDELLALARSLLPGRLVQIPATNDLGTQLGGLDCLVQVSPREGHSLSLCEAMLCRVPIVSNLTGALPKLERMAGRDLVEHVPDEPTAGEVAAAIRSVCSRPPADRTDAAYRFASAHLTAQVMCSRWQAYLTDAIQSLATT